MRTASSSPRCAAERRARPQPAPPWCSAGSVAASRRSRGSRAAATSTSVSGARRGRGTAGSFASPGTARGCGWSDGIADNSGRTSHSYRIAPSRNGSWLAGTADLHVADPSPVRGAHATRVRAPVGHDQDLRPTRLQRLARTPRPACRGCARCATSELRDRGWPGSRMDSARRSWAAGIQNYLSRFDENADTAPQQQPPLCPAVNTVPSGHARPNERFAESCGALRGFFMEVSRLRANDCKHSGISLFATWRSARIRSGRGVGRRHRRALAVERNARLRRRDRDDPGDLLAALRASLKGT
jgi:hypothetical protein